MAVNPVPVQANSDRRSGVGDVTIGAGEGWNLPTPGNLLFIVASVRNSGAAATISVPGFTTIYEKLTGSETKWGVYRRVADGSEASVTVTFGGVITNASVGITEWAGVDGSAVFDDAHLANSVSGSSVINVPSANAPAGGLALAYGTVFRYTDSLPPLGWSNGYETQGLAHPPAGGSAGSVVGSKVESGGSTSTEITLTASTEHGGGIVTFAEKAATGPEITDTVPATPYPGQTGVLINGSGFGATQGASTVTYGGLACTVTAWSDTQITVTWPNVSAPGSTLAFNANHTLEVNVV